MKKIMFIAALLSMFAFMACQSTKKSEPEVNVKKETDAVKLVLEKYALANENQDMNMIEEIWCPSENIVSIGTETTERLMGFSEIRSAIQRQFENFSETFISYRDQLIELSDDGKTAWFSQTMNYNFIYDGEAHSYKNLRYTGVLTKRDGKWKIVQTHLSVPYNPLTD
jgi:ketosteroid isomerase-like protein